MLSFNPIGLAAYILEKFSTWTDGSFRDRNDGGLVNSTDAEIPLDTLLDNVMIYYHTNSITTSMRLYAEAFSRKTMAYEMDRVQTSVPTGCARFKNDLWHVLDWQLRDKYTQLIHSKWYQFGGHFIAMQRPNDLYRDFIDFVEKVV